MPAVLIGLGSNLGDRQRALDDAVEQLRGTAEIESVRASSWHESTPIGGPTGQARFLNGAALLQTSLLPESLWLRLAAIEKLLGRTRRERWGPRSIDLDLLLYDDLIQSTALSIDTTRICVPHPRMSFRRFVLEPAVEVAPDMRHPLIGWTIAHLLNHLRMAPAYVAISGDKFSATHELAAKASQRCGWPLIEVSGAGDETVPASSPSLTLDRAIEFLREEAALIARRTWPADSPGVITSFWIEDLLAVGDVLWPRVIESLWHEVSASIMPPKLLVSYSAMGVSEGGDHGLRQRIDQARQARTRRLGIGPTLWLSAENPTEAEAELVAAIQAMS